MCRWCWNQSTAKCRYIYLQLSLVKFLVVTSKFINLLKNYYVFILIVGIYSILLFPECSIFYILHEGTTCLLVKSENLKNSKEIVKARWIWGILVELCSKFPLGMYVCLCVCKSKNIRGTFYDKILLYRPIWQKQFEVWGLVFMLGLM